MTGTPRRLAVVVAAALACRAGIVPANGIYKSVDAQGHVVYSDQPDLSAAQTSTEITPDGATAPDVEVRVTEAPPPLPEEQPPPSPDDGELWTPGYWAWSAAGYYWVPGTWVPAPRIGLLWTPGYWVYADSAYVFRRGYWARHVGYYGGINYGHGYFGHGFAGGQWVGNSFMHAPAGLAAQGARNPVSYNRGPGGTTAAPSAQELAVASEPHVTATAMQRHLQIQSERTPALLAPRPVYQVTQEPSRSAPPVPTTARRLLPSPPPEVRVAPTYSQQPAVPRPRPTAVRHVAPRVTLPRR